MPCTTRCGPSSSPRPRSAFAANSSIFSAAWPRRPAGGSRANALPRFALRLRFASHGLRAAIYAIAQIARFSTGLSMILLRDLARKVGRGTLALFTSYSMLNQSYRALKPDLASDGITLLGQGIDGARGSITTALRPTAAPCFWARAVFGKAWISPAKPWKYWALCACPLPCLQSPLSRPIWKSSKNRAKTRFCTTLCPRPFSNFAQGFGRLIRNKSDRGVVIVFDSRVLSTRYGRAFLEGPARSANRAFQRAGKFVANHQHWFDQAEERSGS